MEAGQDDLDFLDTVFTECLDQSALIRIVLSAFYAEDRGVLYRHANLYRVFVYLCIFCIDEVGCDAVQEFAKSVHSSVTTKLFEYLYDEGNWCKQFRPRLRTKYDLKYLDATFIGPLRRHAVQMKAFVQERISRHVAAPCVPKSKTTHPIPFTLTKQMPRKIVEPVPVERVQKPRRVPKSTYIPSQDAQALEERMTENRRQALLRNKKAEEETFTLVKRKPIVATYTKKAHESQSKETKMHLGKLPPTLPAPDIKLNTAAILREEALVRRKEEEDRKLMQEYENGLGDLTTFYQWQDEKRQRDDDKERLDTQRRHLEGLLSHEDAINAKFEQIKLNNSVVREMQEQSEEIQQQILQQEKELEDLNRIKVEEATLSHKKAREAKVNAILEKKERAEELNREMEVLKRESDLQAKEEAERRAQVIREIRALESAPMKRTQKIDLTETSGTGLLLEMSLMELRERLAMLKIVSDKSREERRYEIIKTKEVKQRELNDRLECITKFRVDAREKRGQTREALANRKKKPEPPKDKTILSLERRLQEKRGRRQQAKAQTSSGKQGMRVQKLAFSQREDEKRWFEIESVGGHKA